MRSPTLSELPPPPARKTGWPWDIETPPAPERPPAGEAWPRLSIVTPSFNQGQYLEETIRSVLLQGYLDLEYLVIDGGSTDDSRAILVKYAPWLTYWVSEPDKGQSDAIGKGFGCVTGELVNWLNSDDLYLPGALQAVGAAAVAQPGAIIAGPVVNFRDGMKQERLVRQSGITLEHMVKYWEGRYRWHQPGIFLPRAAYLASGGIDAGLRYAMDHDLICRILQQEIPVIYLEQAVARFRLHQTSKTCSQSAAMAIETAQVVRRYWPLVTGVSEREARAYLFGELFRFALSSLVAGDSRKAREITRQAFGAETGATAWRVPEYLVRYLCRRIGRLFSH